MLPVGMHVLPAIADPLNMEGIDMPEHIRNFTLQARIKAFRHSREVMQRPAFPLSRVQGGTL